MCRDVGITIFVLGIKKLRPALDHLAPAFPFSVVSYIPYISVRLTGQFYLKSKTRHTSEFQTSILMTWTLKSWAKEVYGNSLHEYCFERNSYVYTGDSVFLK